MFNFIEHFKGVIRKSENPNDVETKSGLCTATKITMADEKKIEQPKRSMSDKEWFEDLAAKIKASKWTNAKWMFSHPPSMEKPCSPYEACADIQE